MQVNHTPTIQFNNLVWGIFQVHFEPKWSYCGPQQNFQRISSSDFLLQTLIAARNGIGCGPQRSTQFQPNGISHCLVFLRPAINLLRPAMKTLSWHRFQCALCLVSLRPVIGLLRPATKSQICIPLPISCHFNPVFKPDQSPYYIHNIKPISLAI